MFPVIELRKLKNMFYGQIISKNTTDILEIYSVS